MNGAKLTTWNEKKKNENNSCSRSIDGDFDDDDNDDAPVACTKLSVENFFFLCANPNCFRFSTNYKSLADNASSKLIFVKLHQMYNRLVSV